jgi:ABC-type multidrug transport system fused ATPase/permease subunit
MKSFVEFWKLTQHFPRLLIIASALLVLDALLSILSVVSIAPLVDLILDKPKDQWLGVTHSMERAIRFVGLPFSVFTAASVIWLSMLGMAVVSVLVRWMTLRIRFEVARRLLQESYENIYAAKWGFFSSVKKGSLINTFTNEINKVGGAFLAMAASFANIVRICALVAIPVYLAPGIVLMCLAGSVVALIPFLIMGRWTYRFGSAQVAASNRFVSLVKESLEAAKEVIGFGRKGATMKQVNGAYTTFANSTIKAQLMSFFSSQMYEPASFLMLLAVLFLARGQDAAMSTITVVLWGLVRTVPLLKQIIYVKHQLDNFLPSLEQVRGQQRLAHSFKSDSGGRRFDELGHSLEARNISFSFGGGMKALQDVSIDVPHGEITALVGESGSGKSTLVDLLIGLHKPDSGEILVDGAPLHGYDMQTWHERIGFVPQKPVLFDLTIKDNLLWSAPNASEPQLREACRAAGLDSFIETLPEGINTDIGDAGIRLSGGQAQRLALARALVRKPVFLVLDEATSALDSEKESGIYDSLLEIAADTAVLIIAHRLNMVTKADNIYVMKSGRVTESGTFDELANREGYFKRLLHFHGSG